MSNTLDIMSRVFYTPKSQVNFTGEKMKKKNRMSDIAIGIGIGIDVAMDNIGMGIAIGAAMGVAFGAAFNKHDEQSGDKS